MNDERPDFTWEEFAAGKGPGGEPPPRDADRFRPCFRHADRTTGITCQRCDRPICGECMRPASVGFQCPVCVAEQQMNAPTVTNRVGRPVSGRGAGGGVSLGGLRLSGGPWSTTAAIMVVMASVALIDLVSGGVGSGLLAFSGPAIAGGEIWRLVTGIFVAGGLFNLLINLLFLWLIGRTVEAEIGRWRMLAVMLLSGLGGATALMLFSPVGGWPLAYAAILGLLAAVAAMKLRFGEDIRGDLILLGIMVAFSVVVGSVPGWISQLGAIVAGGAAGAVLAYAPRQARTRWQILGFAGIAVACVVVTLARLMVG